MARCGRGARCPQRCVLGGRGRADPCTLTPMDDELHARCIFTLRTCADDSVICGLTAARLHGFWLPNVPDDVHVAITEPAAPGRSMVRSRRGDVVAHRRQFSLGDQTMVDGIQTTSPAQTWLDLASVLSLPNLVAAGDSALRGGTSVSTLDDVVRRSAGRRGIRAARLALPLLDARSRSRPESHLRVAISADDLPRFEVNAAVHRDEGGWLAEPDLSLAAAKIALEYQGEDHAELSQMRKDITRSTDLRRSGWLTLFYGPAEVFVRPWQIGPEVRHLIRQRNPDLLGTAPRIRRRSRRVVVHVPEWSRSGRPLEGVIDHSA